MAMKGIFINELVWTTFTEMDHEWTIFTVHKWEQMILQSVYFPDLTINDWEWLENYHSRLLMTEIAHSHLPFINSQ